MTRKTVRVIDPNGQAFTILKPRDGMVTVITVPGAEVRGRRYFEPTMLNLSDNYAYHLIKEGAAVLAPPA